MSQAELDILRELEAEEANNELALLQEIEAEEASAGIQQEADNMGFLESRGRLLGQGASMLTGLSQPEMTSKLEGVLAANFPSAYGQREGETVGQLINRVEGGSLSSEERKLRAAEEKAGLFQEMLFKGVGALPGSAALTAGGVGLAGAKAGSLGAGGVLGALGASSEAGSQRTVVDPLLGGALGVGGGYVASKIPQAAGALKKGVSVSAKKVVNYARALKRGADRFGGRIADIIGVDRPNLKYARQLGKEGVDLSNPETREAVNNQVARGMRDLNDKIKEGFKIAGKAKDEILDKSTKRGQLYDVIAENLENAKRLPDNTVEESRAKKAVIETFKRLEAKTLTSPSSSTAKNVGAKGFAPKPKELSLREVDNIKQSLQRKARFDKQGDVFQNAPDASNFLKRASSQVRQRAEDLDETFRLGKTNQVFEALYNTVEGLPRPSQIAGGFMEGNVSSRSKLLEFLDPLTDLPEDRLSELLPTIKTDLDAIINTAQMKSNVLRSSRFNPGASLGTFVQRNIVRGTNLANLPDEQIFGPGSAEFISNSRRILKKAMNSPQAFSRWVDKTYKLDQRIRESLPQLPAQRQKMMMQLLATNPAVITEFGRQGGVFSKNELGIIEDPMEKADIIENLLNDTQRSSIDKSKTIEGFLDSPRVFTD